MLADQVIVAVQGDCQTLIVMLKEEQLASEISLFIDDILCFVFGLILLFLFLLVGLFPDFVIDRVTQDFCTTLAI